MFKFLLYYMECLTDFKYPDLLQLAPMTKSYKKVKLSHSIPKTFLPKRLLVNQDPNCGETQKADPQPTPLIGQLTA